MFSLTAPDIGDKAPMYKPFVRNIATDPVDGLTNIYSVSLPSGVVLGATGWNSA